MKTTYSFISVLISLSAASGFAAETVSSQQSASQLPAPASTAVVPSAPKLSLSLRSMYYEMQGKRWALNDMYGFNDASLSLQLLTAAYALSPAVSIIATTSYNRLYLETALPNAPAFNDTSEGIADTKLLARHPAIVGGGHALLLEGGASLPTGSIEIATKRPSGARLAYNFQMGSGTVDPIAAATYSYTSGPVTSGARTQATLRLADNKNGYHLGHEYVGALWTDYRLIGNYLVPGLRFNAKNKRGVKGVDPAIKRNQYNEFYYHPQSNWDLTFVTKSTIPLGLAGASLALEAGLPLAQDTINTLHYHIATEFFGSAGIQVAM